MKDYVTYMKVTKENLDTLSIGDLVRINNWNRPMKIKGVSENYAVMSQNSFGETYYSVIEKKPWNGIRHNAMISGYFHCGKDFWLFGAPNFDYNFNDQEGVKNYLQTFENGESKLSERNAIPILKLYVKRGEIR